MKVYDDLPEELQRYFPAHSVSISPELRQVIVSGWALMSETERADLRANVQGQRDFDIRVQKAVQAATESLLRQADIKDLNI